MKLAIIGGILLAAGLVAALTGVLLWHQQLAGEDLTVKWGRYALLGLATAPLVVLFAVVPLVLVTG